VEYSGMKEIVWGVWKERENMNADMKWLDNPEVFKVNQLEAHSDHCYYLDYSDMKKEKNPLLQSLNGQWEFAYSKNVMERPVDFYKETFDASGFDKIMVPGHIELAGYDKIRYINTMYPWEGKEYHRGAYSMESTGKEAGMFSEAEYNPVGSYIKRFDLNETMCGKRIHICFEGVEEAMYLWLNGQFVGYAEDSFTPSEFDLTPFIREKENVLAVQVHKMSTAAFLEDQDFFRFFGIFRNVTLKALPDAHMEDVWFQPVLNQDNSSGKVSVIMKVTAPEKQNVDARFVLTDREGTVITEKCLQLQGRDGIFTGTIHTDVQNIKLWDNHSPYLYHACVELIEENGVMLEVVPYDIGFRRLEVIDKVIYLNGKRLVITGVNRHEWNPKTGRCIGMQEMTADIDCMLRNNINAVRTCHYPDQIPWYYLCDKAGIYVMAETNLESHGTFQKLGAIEPSCNVPGSIPQWREVVLDRAISNFETFKNHTSVLFWSLGNESYAGDDLGAMNTYFKEKRDGRLVHYESSFYNRAYEDTISDVESRMYAKPKEVEEYLNNNPKKPYLLCEFMHDMGNSMGGLGSYMKLIDQYEMYHGGFIWDFIDQAILIRDPVTGKEVLRYGGDFDDRPADYEFSANGIVFADRKEKPAMQEVRYYYGLYR
jgi:beta-galactosidase